MNNVPSDGHEHIAHKAHHLRRKQQAHWVSRARGAGDAPRGPETSERESCGRSRQKSREARRRAHQKKRARFDALKQGPCADCGGTFHPFVMDFDHREGTEKLFGVALAVNMNIAWGRVLAEVAKCDLVCANCHRMRTLRRIEATRLPVPPSPLDPARCRRGHPRTDETTSIRRKKGRRQVCVCLVCEREAERARRKGARCVPVPVIPGVG